MQCLLHHNKDKNTLECPRIHCSCSFTILSFYFYFYFLFLHVRFFLFPFVSTRSFSSLSVLCLYFILSLLLSLLLFVLYDLFLLLVSTSSLFLCTPCYRFVSSLYPVLYSSYHCSMCLTNSMLLYHPCCQCCPCQFCHHRYCYRTIIIL